MRVCSTVGRNPLARSSPMAVPKRFMADTDVKRLPDLERWNNVRDNIDQVNAAAALACCKCNESKSDAIMEISVLSDLNG
jgi:hypothetical protein